MYAAGISIVYGHSHVSNTLTSAWPVASISDIFFLLLFAFLLYLCESNTTTIEGILDLDMFQVSWLDYL